MQHDAIVETLLSCGIPVGNVKVVCDEGQVPDTRTTMGKKGSPIGLKSC